MRFAAPAASFFAPFGEAGIWRLLIRDPPEKLPRIRAAFRARKFVVRNLLGAVLKVICAEPLTPNSCSDRIDRRSKHAVQAVDPWRGGKKLKVRVAIARA